MLPALNQVLFFITTLFAANAFFYSEQSVLIIDFEKNIVQIDYMDIRTTKRAENYAAEGLKSIEQADDFKQEHPEYIKLLSKKFYKKGANLNMTVKFSFENKEGLLRDLGFRFNDKENIEYHLLAFEKLISTNGESKNDAKNIEWNKNTKKIKLKLQNTDADGVGVLKYWKK